MSPEEILDLDRKTLWHPYSNTCADNPLFAVKSAQGCTLTLTDGRKIIDGMASWWSAVHGYNHPTLNSAATAQLNDMAHVMFGGLTHEPAVALAKNLIALTPDGLDRVFLADSGSVSVEVALKMARQYWIAKKQPRKQKFIAFEGAYHGDTFGAMSVCDPHNGMHQLFSDCAENTYFCPAPSPSFGQICKPEDIIALEQTLKKHAHEIAAIIIEPIVQGAGGMRFYSADFLAKAKSLSQRYNVLFIADEIATGFGRTGKWFACDHANISPDILCLGKALTGGYMTLAATLCSEEIANTISQSEAGALMHGPTFMANPLACAVANASIELLKKNQWPAQVKNIEKQLKIDLSAISNIDGVKEVRVFGAIGVVELETPVDMQRIQPFIVSQDVWLRPFGRLLYTMPPYCISRRELHKICEAMKKTCEFHRDTLSEKN